MLTAGRLARRFGLSRGTLLHYDALGLLRPSGRSPAGYRMYAPGDVARLERICLYRGAGLPLAAIARLLDAPEGTALTILEDQLRATAGLIAALRHQQRVLLSLLGAEPLRDSRPVLDKARWTALLAAAGLDDDGMRRWHAEFERTAPEAHDDLLRSLGIADDEVAAVRARARSDAVTGKVTTEP